MGFRDRKLIVEIGIRVEWHFQVVMMSLIHISNGKTKKKYNIYFTTRARKDFLKHEMAQWRFAVKKQEIVYKNRNKS